MTRPIVIAELAADAAAKVAAGRAAHAAAIEERGPNDVEDRKIIDQVITLFAMNGRPFSANDMRRHLPADIRKGRISGRLLAAQHAGQIRRVGKTPSTLKSTKAAEVNVYAPVNRPTSTSLVKELHR